MIETRRLALAGAAGILICAGASEATGQDRPERVEAVPRPKPVRVIGTPPPKPVRVIGTPPPAPTRVIGTARPRTRAEATAVPVEQTAEQPSTQVDRRAARQAERKAERVEARSEAASGPSRVSGTPAATGTRATAMAGDPAPGRVLWGATPVGLIRGERYVSPSGTHHLIYQPDGNLVVYEGNNRYVWGMQSLTPRYAQVTAVSFRDGNIVARGADGAVIWSALPADRTYPGTRLALSPTGELQLNGPQGPLWSSTRGAVAAPPASTAAARTSDASATPAAGRVDASITKFPIPAGTLVPANREYASRSGGHKMSILQGQEIAVLAADNSDTKWRLSNAVPAGRGVTEFGLRGDGSFVVLGAGGREIWAAPMARRDPASRLDITSAGILQVVAPNGDILWASDGLLEAPVKAFGTAKVTECAPAAGWDKCYRMAEPAITIQGSRLTGRKAMIGAANVYAAMFRSLDPAKYPPARFDGFTVYMTNGEPFSEIKQKPPAGTMWPDVPGQKGGNFLRGGASTDFLWIEEQMICKAGVATRNANLAASGLTRPDLTYRSFDQVVHEMGHSMEARYANLRAGNDPVFARHPASRAEGFAIAAQGWFGAGSTLPESERKYLAENVFRERVSFSCDGY